MDGEGSTGGGSSESLADAFAAHFDGPSEDEPAPVAESQEEAAARLAAEDAAAAEKPEPIEADPDAPAEPEKLTIEVDGKPVELTKAEIAEHYKNGLRQSDYSRKTAEVAETRKAAEAETAQARAAREEYAGKLDTFTQQANYEVNALKAQLTDELLQSDPVAFLQIQRTADQRQAQLQQANQELQQINGQRQQEQADAHKSRILAQHQALLDKLPEWKDSAKAEAEAAKIRQFLADQGYKPEEMSFDDHREILMARKAMLYDALMARAKVTQTKVEKAPPKVARTGSPAVAPTDGRTKAMRDLASTGSRDAAAAVFADMFG